MFLRRRLSQKALQVFRMSNKATTHVERTAEILRSEVTSEASVVKIENVSSTVKAIRLKIQNNEFSFLAGQWVDFIIPNLKTVGGYSMCSNPVYLKETGMLDLAVKNSSHPPAHWIHNECKVGDVVLLKVGGKCIWRPCEPKLQKNTLFIAGGIGVNPILSMLLHQFEARKGINNCNERSILLYSASTNDELIFKERIDSLSSGSEKLMRKYFVTKEIPQGNPDTHGRRICQDDILEAVKTLNEDNEVQCYLCGPPPMIKSMLTCLNNSGVEKSFIHYEQWW